MGLGDLWQGLILGVLSDRLATRPARLFDCDRSWVSSRPSLWKTGDGPSASPGQAKILLAIFVPSLIANLDSCLHRLGHVSALREPQKLADLIGTCDMISALSKRPQT
jgi:hypothetical protein